jgi:hypothetical protein
MGDDSRDRGERTMSVAKFMTVLTRWDEHCRVVEVRGIVAGYPARVGVSQSKSLDTFEPKAPIVSVSSFGSIHEKSARELVNLLTFAADTARRMGAVKKWSQFVLPAGWPTAKILYVTITKRGPRLLK